MLSLKDHPFAVEAFFERSAVFAYAVRREEAEHLIPECLELDTFDDKWAFVAIAMVQTTNLRPEGFPRVFGSDFSLVGYRAFVRYTNNEGKRVRGLYILRSETTSPRMRVFGNLFTHYNYRTTDITYSEEDDTTRIVSINSDLNVAFEETDDPPLPPDSPFADWKEARRFEGPLPFTFTYEATMRKVVIIEGVRQNWLPQPVRVLDHHFGFVDSLGFTEKRLANAFVIRNIPYLWKKGRVEYWQPK